MVDGSLRLLELVDPAPVEGLGDAALADEKCPQAVLRVLAEVLQGFLFDFVILSRIGQQREEDRVSTLAEYLDLPTRLLDDDGHPLALGVELDDVQELVLVQLRLLVMIVLDDELVSIISLHELNTIVLGSVEQGELVRAGAGEQRFDGLVFRIVASEDGVAEREMVEEPLDLLIPLIALVLDHPLQI